MAKKLYGTDPDQVPTNADLGTMAYQDKDNASISKIDAPDDGEMLINSRNSNGDVIIGNTVVNPVSGYAAQKGFGYDGSTGTVEIATNANQAAMQIGKNNTNTGDLVVFRKESVVVGNISTAYNGSGSYLSIGTDDVNLYFFDDTNPAVLPRKDNDGVSDGYVDLGNTGNRFKRLYLADNIIMANGAGIDFSATGNGSGTVSSEVLDDYEEGTWTINTAGDATGVIAANSYGLYRRIGDLVYVQGVFQVSTNFTSGSIGGLPFNPKNESTIVSSLHSNGLVRCSNIVRFVQCSNGSSTLLFLDDDGTARVPTTSTDPFRFSITYRAV